MSMLKTTLITCGLLFCLILEIHGITLKTFTKRWTANYTFPPNIVKVNGHLLVVGMQNNTVIISSTYDGNQSNTCKHDFFKPDEFFIDQTKVTALGNGMIVIHTVISESDKERNVRIPWRLLLILDPFDCSTLRKMEFRRYRDYTFEALVPYRDSFDVFFHNSSKDNGNALKVPHRYNDQGKPVELENFNGFENQYLIGKTETIEPHDASKGYVSYMYSGKGYVLRLLNSRFETLKEIVAENYIDNFSATYGKVNYCYSTTKDYQTTTHNDSKTMKETGREHVICEFLDANLKSKATVELQKPVEMKRVYDSIVTNLPDGGVLVTVAYKDSRETNSYPMKIYVQHINADGSRREPVEIFTRLIYYQRVMETILLDNEEVCFVNGGLMEPSYKEFESKKYGIWIDCALVSEF